LARAQIVSKSHLGALTVLKANFIRRTGCPFVLVVLVLLIAWDAD
jgi:hypothetical protein